MTKSLGSKGRKISGARAARKAAASITRGTQIGRFAAVGTASDGTVIYGPLSKPERFTLEQLDEAVRSVKARQQDQSLAPGLREQQGLFEPSRSTRGVDKKPT